MMINGIKMIEAMMKRISENKNIGTCSTIAFPNEIFIPTSAMERVRKKNAMQPSPLSLTQNKSFSNFYSPSKYSLLPNKSLKISVRMDTLRFFF